MTKYILITGVSSGIGYAAAKDLIEQGCKVFGSVRKAADGERVRAELGESFIPLLFDVNDAEKLAAAVAQVASTVGPDGLAGLVNNAGVSCSGPLMHLPLEEFEQVMAINVTGLLRVTQAFLPLLGAGKRSENPGRIVNVSSVSGGVAIPMMGGYSASKYAVEAVTDTLRRELSIYGIQVAGIEPGPTKTPIWSKDAQQMAENRYANTDYAYSMTQVVAMAEREGRTGKPVATVTAAIRHALLAARPKARYPLNGAWYLRTLLASKIMDGVLCKQVGLNKRA